ncbi:MAG: hypothetical protein PHE73_03460 [Sulfurovaceae bacterium]|nr:hypothetical protein [Sulfurovaceae bacterium]
MSYELFKKKAMLNDQFEVIPSNTGLLAGGVIIDKDGYIQYKGKTYITNMVKLVDMPEKLQHLFVEQKNQLPTVGTIGGIITADDNKKDGLSSLNKILFEQLQNIVDPDDGTDMQQELKKANAVCNVADKIIGIADLSLKAEMFIQKKKDGFR